MKALFDTISEWQLFTKTQFKRTISSLATSNCKTKEFVKLLLQEAIDNFNQSRIFITLGVYF